MKKITLCHLLANKQEAVWTWPKGTANVVERFGTMLT